jgi:two-component system, NarL family, sensor kinase
MNRPNLSELIQEINLTDHLQNIPLGVIGFNSDREIIYWSAMSKEIFGWREEEVLGRRAVDIGMIYEEDLERVNAVIKELFAGRKVSNQCSNRNYNKSGKIIYCNWYNSAVKDANGDIVSVLSLVQEVTEYKQAIMQQEQSLQLLSLIYNSAIDPMCLLNVEDGEQLRFQSVNASFSKILGLSESQVVGQLIDEVLPGPSFHSLKVKSLEAVHTGKVIDFIDITPLPIGERVGEIRVIPIKNEQGNFNRVLCMANDLTEKYLMQKKLDAERESVNRRITAAVIKSQEMERVNLSRELHDNVNQVLTTVKLYTELCETNDVDPSVYLPKCSSLLTDTINEIRRLSKQLAAPPIGTITLGESLKELANSIRQARKLNLHLHMQPLPCTSIEEDLQLTVYRIAQEHLTNVLKHSGASDVDMELKCDGKILSLSIADNGIGFDTSQKTGGLGITNMYSRTNMFNGALDIKSAPGQGCTLSVQFPVNCIQGKCHPA